MNEDLTLLQRLKKARIVQVLAVYLGASWVVLQIADVLQDAVGLPQWVSALAVLLTTAKEEAGEIPTDWEIAPAEALASLKSGKLPHLTWGRAIMGGVVSLSLLFGGTGLYVGFAGTRGVIGPQEAGADVAATGIAVVPFSVSGGEDLELWREGMVDLLSTNLDGMGGFRTIDSRTVLARWGEEVAEGIDPDLRTALEVAARTGARYALVGSLVGNPAGVRLDADLYDLSSGDEVAQVSRGGAAEEVLALTSALSVDVTRELLKATGQGSIQELRLGALTTTSLPALRAYLEGEAIFRNGDFAGAVAAYERAVEQDSLFALAWSRLSSAYGWLDDIGSPAGAAAGERAVSLVDRLPARDRIVIRGGEAARIGDASYYGEIQEAVRLYPDDPDIWFELGEYIYHVGVELGIASLDQGIQAFDRAIELDPGFGPYRVHPLELSVATGDRAAADARLAAYREATQDVRNVNEASLAIPLILGSEEEAAEVLRQSRSHDIGTMARIRTAYTNRSNRYDRLFELMWVNRDRAGADHQWMQYSLIAQGALQRANRLMDSLEISVGNKGLAMGWALGQWPSARDLSNAQVALPQNCEAPEVSGQCQLFVGWGRARAGDLTIARESARILRGQEAEGSAFSGRSAGVVEGTIASVEGRVSDARRLLAPVAHGVGNEAALARISLADLELSEGNVTEAIRYYGGGLYDYNRFNTARALARIYEQRGDTEQAIEYYRTFMEITRAGDPDLPDIVEAREALARLGG
jgi:tetratricopeptide (TPR) repeat protein